MSSDTVAVTVLVAGDSVRITALAKGAATIAVTARDPTGLEARHAFAVTVPNRGPVVTDMLPRRLLEVGDTLEVDLSGHFSDPDGDALSYMAASSNTSVVEAAIAGEILAIVALNSDSATIIVSATDTDGLSIARDFTIMIANRAPEAVDTTPDLTLTEGDTAVLDLSAHFRDPDGDTLSYAPESSREIRVKVAVTGDSLILSAETAGSSTISVTARDAGGLSATQRFRAVVEPAPIPDLVVGTPTVDADSVEVGGEFTLSAVVRNQGEGKATSSTTLRFFDSDNPRITTSDSLLGTYPVGQLDTAATSVGSLMVLAPTAAGTYYYGACVGALDNESDTGNNCSGAVRVRVWQPNRAPAAGRHDPAPGSAPRRFQSGEPDRVLPRPRRGSVELRCHVLGYGHRCGGRGQRRCDRETEVPGHGDRHRDRGGPLGALGTAGIRGVGAEPGA